MPVHVTNFNITAQGNSGTNGNVAPYLVDYAIGNSSRVVVILRMARVKRGMVYDFGPIRAISLEYILC